MTSPEPAGARLTDPPPRPPSIWRQPAIRWIFVARIGSVAGDWLYQIALIWLVLEVTGSPLALSIVSLAQIIPLIVMSTLFSGRLARIITPRGLAGFDLLQALTVMAFPILYWTGQLNLGWFVAVTIVITLLDSVCDPGLQAIVPQLTDRARIPAVHSLFDVTKRLGRILGPGFTSLLLVVLPIVGLFVVDALSFVLSAICMLFAGRIVGRTRARVVPEQPPPAGSGASVRYTFAYLRRHGILLWLFTVRNSQNLLWAIYLIGVPVLVQQTYQSGPGVWGLLITTYASGQLLGNFITTRRRGYRSVVGYVLVGWILAGLGFVGLGLFDSPLAGAICLFVGGAGSAAANVSSDSYVGMAVPTDVQPAAFSWQFSGNQMTQLLGTAAFGMILSVAPAKQVVALTGVAMLGVVALAALVARGRQLRPETV